VHVARTVRNLDEWTCGFDGPIPSTGRYPRPVATVRTVERFDADLERAVRALAASAAVTDSVPPFGDDTWRAFDGTAPGTDVGLVIAAGDPPDEVAAYAHLAHHHDGEWSLELAARPDAVDDLTSLVDAALTTVAARGGGHVSLWDHGGSPALDALADLTGFTPERELLQLRVELPVVAPARWPDGVSVRPFHPGEDEAAWVEVNNRAFAGHPEQGDWTVDVVRAREREAWFDPLGFLLAFDDEGLAGFCWTKVHPADPPEEPVALGEIFVIGADPRWHGRGLGRALTTRGLEWLHEHGIAVGMLYVDGANTAAVGLYRALGFVDHRIDRAYGRTVAPGAAP
jgi:mycothiol synthase